MNININIKNYLLDYIEDISWYGETNHDDRSYNNMDKADEVLSYLEDIRDEILDTLYEHNNYRKGNASAEMLHGKAYRILKKHCDYNPYGDLDDTWEFLENQE